MKVYIIPTLLLALMRSCYKYETASLKKIQLVCYIVIESLIFVYFQRQNDRDRMNPAVENDYGFAKIREVAFFFGSANLESCFSSRCPAA